MSQENSPNVYFFRQTGVEEARRRARAVQALLRIKRLGDQMTDPAAKQVFLADVERVKEGLFRD